MVFLEILQNSQENTCARVSFLIKLQASGKPQASEISKNTFFHRTPLVAAFVCRTQSNIYDELFLRK